MVGEPGLARPGERVTIAEAARRLGMSPSWLKEWAREAGIEIDRQGRKRQRAISRGGDPSITDSPVQEIRTWSGPLAGEGRDLNRPGVHLVGRKVKPEERMEADPFRHVMQVTQCSPGHLLVVQVPVEVVTVFARTGEKQPPPLLEHGNDDRDRCSVDASGVTSR